VPWTEKEIAARLAKDIEEGWIVNLGVGLPTLVAEQLVDRPVFVHAENGILGVGPRPEPGHEDPDVIDPGKVPVTTVLGAAFMDSVMSFGLIRGGHLDLAVMGAFQVSQDGDLANWRVAGRRGGAIGGAADLAAGAKRVWVMTTHQTKTGDPKLVRDCSYPLTARGVVSRVYTDLGVFDVAGGLFRVVDRAPHVDAASLASLTGGRLDPTPAGP
jgi:3-oxoacid CoA-transferase B subunit